MQRLIVIVLSAFFFLATPAFAKEGPAGRWIVSQRSGDVRVVHRGLQPASVKANASLAPGDIVLTGATGRATLARGSDYIVVAPRSELRLPAEAQPGGFTRVMQRLGTMLFKVKHTGVPHFAVDTPMLAAVVKGTTFTVIVDKDRSAVQVLEGAVQVVATDGGMQRLVTGGHTVFIDHSNPKQLIVATPQTLRAAGASSGTAVRITGSGDESVSELASLTTGLVRAETVPVPAVAPADMASLVTASAPLADDGALIPDPTAKDLFLTAPGGTDLTDPPVIEPVADLLPVIKPVVDPIADLLPVADPIADLLPVIEPVADLLPVVDPIADLLPVVEPVVDLLPVVDPIADLLPVIEPVVDLLPVDPIVDLLPVKPIIEPILEPVVDLLPILDPVVEPIADLLPIVEPILDPILEPIADLLPILDPVLEPVVDLLPIVDPILEPVVDLLPVLDPVIEPIADLLPIVEPILDPIVEPIVDLIPAVEPILDPILDPILEPVVEPILDLIVEPVVEPILEPIIEPILEPVVEPILEPVVEPIVEPIVETIVEPILDSIPESILEPIVEPVIEPVVEILPPLPLPSLPLGL